MYVLLCPLISASSLTPPRDILTNSRPIDLAIDLPKEVLPTPGGPVKHRIGPLTVSSWVTFFLSDLTARYSNTLSFTFGSP